MPQPFHGKHEGAARRLTQQAHDGASECLHPERCEGLSQHRQNEKQYKRDDQGNQGRHDSNDIAQEKLLSTHTSDLLDPTHSECAGLNQPSDLNLSATVATLRTRRINDRERIAGG